MTEHDEKLKTLTEKVRIDLTKVKRREPKETCKTCKLARSLGTVVWCGCMK